MSEQSIEEILEVGWLPYGFLISAAASLGLAYYFLQQPPSLMPFITGLLATLSIGGYVAWQSLD